MLTPNTILQNRYRIVRELGHGGMGTVYEAVDQRVNCIVALKETVAGNDSEARRAFEREASLLANLRHSTLPKVMDYFTEDDGDFLVMEFIPGYDLAEMLKLRGDPFPQTQVLRWAYDLLRVLEYLHSQDPPILHRDIKPSNMKLTKQGEVFLLDFGLAKGSLGQMKTVTNDHSRHGYTAAYAPREQILGQGTDPRSDVYSLGATLYHLLAGQHPVDAPTRDAAVEKETPDPLPLIETLNPEVSPAVSAVIHQAMAIRARERFVSAAEMRKALRNAVEEDDRRAAEDEYSRAEARRQELDESRRKSEEEALKRAEEERQRQEAETKRLEEARRQEAERLRLEEELEKRRLEEEVGRAEEERLAKAETLRQAEEEARRAREEAARRKAEEQPQKTIPAPPPKPFSFEPDDQGAVVDGTPERKSWSTGRKVLIGAIILGAILVAILPFTSLFSSSNKQKGISPVTQIPPGMVYVPPGTFMMGSDNGERDEKPVHQVSIKNGFYMGKYEVTQAEWQMAMGNNPSFFKGNDLPVDSVSWEDAQNYIVVLNQRGDGFTYRLPTEAEWEFACRAGTTGEYAGDLDSMAWYGNNSGRQYLTDFSRLGPAESYDVLEKIGAQTHPVGSKSPNAFGLYDMHGNVFEWCQDLYHESYEGAPADGSAWEHGNQTERVYRGGAWSGYASFLRSAKRGSLDSNARVIKNNGLRVVATRLDNKSNATATQPVVVSQSSPNQPAPSIIPTPTPLTTVQARLRLLDQGAMHYSPFPDLVVTLRVGGQTITRKTDKGGWATFNDVPCGQSVTINSKGFLQSGSDWQVQRNLPCQEKPVLIGAFGAMGGKQLTKEEWKYILER